MVRAGLFGCVGIVFALAVAGALVPPVASGTPVRIAAPAAGSEGPTWIGISHPLQLFDLAGSPFVRLPLTYEAQRRTDGSARQDVLTFGAFGAASAFLRLSLHTGEGERDRAADLVVTSARIAGSAGIAMIRAGQPEVVPTRFGLFAVAPVTLKAQAAERPCAGFQLQGQPAVAIAGIACGPEGRVLDRAELACALDRLDLASAGDDAGLQAFFVDAERRRKPGCGVQRTA